MPLSTPTPPVGRPVVGGTTYLSLPGVVAISVTTSAQAADFCRYLPYYTPTPLVIDQLVCETTVAAAAGKLLRLGVYEGDKNWLPGKLLADSGALAADAAPGVVTASITPVVVHGLFFLCWNTDGAPTLREVRGFLANTVLLPTLGASPVQQTLRATQTFGAFPATAATPTSLVGGTIGFQYFVFPRISTP